MSSWLPAEPHVPIVEFCVRYLGRAAPADVPDRLVAVQNALFTVCQPGTALGPLDTAITVFTSGLLAESPQVHGAVDKWWPIQDLVECGAFTPTGDAFQPFLPITEEERKKKKTASGAVLFAMTFRRRDIPTIDTWVFACGTVEVAFALVDSTTAMHGNRSGWASSATDRPPGRPSQRQQDVFQAPVRGPQRISEWDGAIASEGFLTGKREYLKDYYEKPKLSGFFYASSPSLVQKYSVSELQMPIEGQESEDFHEDAAGYTQQVEMDFPPEQNIDPYGAAQPGLDSAGDTAQCYGFDPAYDVNGMMQLRTQEYIDPSASCYETRIVAQPGGPNLGYYPFADTDLYERRLPVAATGFYDPR